MQRNQRVAGAGGLRILKKICSVRKNLAGWGLVIPSILLFYFFVWRPIFVGMSMSMYQMQGYSPVKFVGLQNFQRVLTDTMFLSTLKNTLLYVFWSLVIGYLPPLIVAIMLNEIRAGRSVMKFAIYFPAVVPAIVSSLLWYTIYYPDASGLLNMVLGRFGGTPVAWLQNGTYTILMIVISMTWNGFGSTTILYLASLQGINRELYEAAVMDGAGILRRIRSITLPNIYGVMLLFFARQIIGVFQVMEQPLAMTGGGPGSSSLSLALQTYRYAFVYFRVDNAMANGVITFFIILIMTCFYFYLEKRTSDM